jgi:hypothetical protein
MTGAEFAAYIRYMTRTDAYTLSDADIVLLANARMETMARGIMGADEDTLVLPHTTNLLAGVRNYPFPNSILSRIKYVEAKFSASREFVTLTELDVNNYGRPTDEATIVSLFTNDEGSPRYDIYRKQLMIYSGTIIAVTAGLKLWCNTYPKKIEAATLLDAITDLSEDPTATEHGFPQELHELWARGVSIDYKQSREKPIPLSEKELSWRVDYMEAIVDLKHGNLDREVFASVPGPETRGNNGLEY